jgi:uncharacterized surface protein with fasciclin (FAS1) repeats
VWCVTGHPGRLRNLALNHRRNDRTRVRLLETNNRAILTKVLTFHVVSGRLRASQLTNGQTLTTVEGTQLTVSIANGVVRITGPGNAATVTVADVVAKNGVIHVIDTVLLP